MIFGEDYFGFVYLWYDTKHKRFLIGSHHGPVDDGYTTSTGGIHLRRIFKVRPNSMKRKILEYNTLHDDFKYTQQLEQKWLDKRPNICDNPRYYNMKNWARGGIDKSIKRTKPPHWVDGHSKRQHKMVEDGTHPSMTPAAKKRAYDVQMKRVEDGTHHFLHADFNKKPFRLYKNGEFVDEFESNVDAVNKGWNACLIDKLRKYGRFTITITHKKSSHLYVKGDTFTYADIT